MLQSLFQSLKEAKEFITIWTNAAWNGFFENIWKKRCEVVTIWEKANGISPTNKKDRNRLSNRAFSKAPYESKEGGVADSQNQITKEEKEESEKRIQSSWLDSVVGFIGRRIRPFFYGPNG